MFQLIIEGQGLSGQYEWRSSANVTREKFVVIPRRPSYERNLRGLKKIIIIIKHVHRLIVNNKIYNKRDTNVMLYITFHNFKKYKNWAVLS